MQHPLLTKLVEMCHVVTKDEYCPQKVRKGEQICSTHFKEKESGKIIELVDIKREIEIPCCRVLVSSGKYCSYDVTTEDCICEFHNSYRNEGNVLKFEEQIKEKGCIVLTRNGIHCSMNLANDYLCLTHINLAVDKKEMLVLDSPEIPIPETKFKTVICCRAIVKETGKCCQYPPVVKDLCTYHSKEKNPKLSVEIQTITKQICKVYIKKNNKECDRTPIFDGMCKTHLKLFNERKPLILREPVVVPDHMLIISESRQKKPKKKFIENKTMSCRYIFDNNTVCPKNITNEIEKLCNEHYNHLFPPVIPLIIPLVSSNSIIRPRLKIITEEENLKIEKLIIKEDLNKNFQLTDYVEKCCNDEFEEKCCNDEFEEKCCNDEFEEICVDGEIQDCMEEENEDCMEEENEDCMEGENEDCMEGKDENQKKNQCRVITMKKNINCSLLPVRKFGLCGTHLTKHMRGEELNFTKKDRKPKHKSKKKTPLPKIYGECKIMIKIGHKCDRHATENGICINHNKNINNEGKKLYTQEELEKLLIYREPWEMCKAIKFKNGENCRNPIFDLDLILCKFHIGMLNKRKPFATREIPITTRLKKKSKLLKDNFPHLLKEWDYEKNKHLDINTITYGSSAITNWICFIYKHEYSTPLNARTAENSGCLECYQNSIRISDKVLVDKVKADSYDKIDNIKTISVGDATEMYVVKLLLETALYRDVKKIGHLGGSSDVCVFQKDGSINQIQIKTLTKIDEKEAYHGNFRENYADDMLIVLVNNERNRFGILFGEKIPTQQTLSLNFSAGFTKYKNVMFKDIEEFKKVLVSLIPKSTKINLMSESIAKEYESLKRMEIYCRERGLTFERNETNGNSIDLYINGKSAQAKFVSVNATESQNYKINCVKFAGRLEGRDIKTPYKEEEFDLFIVNVGGTRGDPDKYMNDFCIIPANILTELDILKSSHSDGQTCFSVCPPDSDRNHWTKQYWNNLTPLF